jgi:hypothetical protein
MDKAAMIGKKLSIQSFKGDGQTDSGRVFNYGHTVDTAIPCRSLNAIIYLISTRNAQAKARHQPPRMDCGE